MFQDDRMISVLSAVVLMVAIGTVIQRADLISGDSSDGPGIVLNTDVVDARANRLLRIDVLHNDEGISQDDRERLALVGQPACGQVFVQEQMLQYLPDATCAGQQIIQYGIQGRDELVGQVIAQMVGSVPAPAQPKPVETRPAEPTVAAKPTPQVVAEASRETAVKPVGEPEPEKNRTAPAPEAPSAVPQAELAVADPVETPSPGVVETLIPGTAPQAAAATPDIQSEPAEEPRTAARDIERTLAADPSEPEPTHSAAATLGTPMATELQTSVTAERATRRVRRTTNGTVLEPGETPAAAQIQKPEIRITAPTLDIQSPDDQPNAPDNDQFDLAAVNGADDVPDRSVTVSTTSGAETEADSGFLVAVIPRKEPNTTAPKGLSISPAREVGLGNLQRTGHAEQGSTSLRIARVDPAQIVRTPDRALGAALPSSPVDASQPSPGLTAVITSTPPRSKPLPPSADNASEPVQSGEALQSAVTGDRDAPRTPEVPTSDQLAALPRHDAPCVIPPAMTIDVRRAARSIISVDAPCHADTVAELEYSNLRIAVPLDGKGRGSQMVLGFEPNAPALLSFVNGETIDFDLPFKGIGRVSRIALVWDLPVNLELNAIEFGASAGSENHVRPDNPRRFEDVRRNGGGFLSTYRSYAGIGQNAQIYSFWHRRGGQQGVVELMIDYASRNRDLLDGTCGDGKYAAPNFLILRSEDARLERPIIRKLAALNCSRVVEEKGDKRLISGAVADLLVVQR